MKKQILLLIMVMFAIGVPTAFAQTPFDPPTCVATASTPAPGELYTYQVSVPAGNGYAGTGNYRWYVTSDVNLITGAVIPNNGTIFTASGGGAYNLLAGGTNSIDIVWTSAALAAGIPYYLVIRYQETNTSATPNCDAMNIKVYRIVPMNAFWLRIESVLNAAGAAGGVEQCAADVTSAVVTEGASPTVEYIYGQNVLYVKISATGYTGPWIPELQIDGLMPDQAIGAAGITWASGATTGTFTGPGGNGIYTSPTPMPSTVAVPPSITGTEIIVTIPIDNNHHQGLADQTIAVSIDGTYVSGATVFNDLSDVNGDCTNETAFADLVNKIIKARPTVDPVNPPAFVPDPLTQP